MIKVLFLIPTLGHGGAEKVLVNLVNNMDASKFDITVQTMFDVGVNRQYLNSNIRYIGGFPYYFRGNTIAYKLFSPKLLYKMYIKEKYDVIVSYLEGPSARVVSGCNDENTKLISWIHIEQKSREYASMGFRSIREAENCYSQFHKIICVSDTVKKDFTDLFKIVKAPEVLYNTVESDKILHMKNEQVDDIMFSNAVNICSVAKLMHTKGFDRLVRIQRKLFDDGKITHIYLLGKGEEKEKLQKMLAVNEMSEYFTFLGYKDNPYKYVAKCDLYVCSSRREGFSTAVTEALIVGIPVISTKCSGANELLGYHDEYGIVTENDEESLYQGIMKMLTEPGMLEHYKSQALERGKSFNTKDTVRRVEKMMEEVINV
jgi:glycosyltransferase involved in cell wall biosynthesis